VGADLQGRAQTFVAVGRRQADVDDHGIQVVAPDILQELVGISALRDDIEPGFVQEPAQALAEEDPVLGDR
jgi:hypothetical protein